MKKKINRPTLKRIAERTGVTANTVSLALRDSPIVAPKTKERIITIAQELGYVHNALAGSLRSGRTNTIAIVLGDISNLLFAIKIHELESKLRKHGYQVLILNTDEDADLELRAIKTAISRHVDGIVICPCQKSISALDLMKQHNVPFVLMGRHFGDAMDAVVWDDRKGSFLATSHLIERGCRRILFLNASDIISSARERADGYKEAMEQANLFPMIRNVSPMVGSVRAEMDVLNSEHVTFDGIFAFSDLMAWEAVCWLNSHNLSIPEDIKIVGFDDILSHISIPFGLSSISADKQAETARVVELLLQKIEHPRENAHVLHKMDVQLVARKSSE